MDDKDNPRCKQKSNLTIKEHTSKKILAVKEKKIKEWLFIAS